MIIEANFKMEANKMAVTGITDPMIQYNRSAESIYNRRPKHGRPYGINRPDTRNIIAFFSGIFAVVIIVSAIY